jgi:hypothetical protein
MADRLVVGALVLANVLPVLWWGRIEAWTHASAVLASLN